MTTLLHGDAVALLYFHVAVAAIGLAAWCARIEE